MFSLILLVFAFVLAVIASVWVSLPDPGRARLVAAALAFYFLACIFGNQEITRLFSH